LTIPPGKKSCFHPSKVNKTRSLFNRLNNNIIMTKNENNDQYLTKTVISARSQKCFDLPILPLCVHSCACARPPKKQKGRRPNSHSTQLTPWVISPEIMARFSWNFGKTKNIFPLGTCYFNAHSLLYWILTWSIILCFFLGPARLWRRGVLWECCPATKPARQVKGLKGNHENVICCSVGDNVAFEARVSWRASCGSPSKNIKAYVEAENTCVQREKRCHNNIYYYILNIMYDLYSNNKRWNLRLNNNLVLITFEG
jgi:hypothetical protein